MATFAKGTATSVEKSKGEIETLVSKYGATKYATGWDNDRASIAFEMKQLRVRFSLPLPKDSDRSVTHTPTGQLRAGGQRAVVLQQLHRERWRAFVLVIKAKLEAVESGIRTFEQEFLNDIVTASGMTIGEMVQPRLLEVATTGKLPPLLPGPAKE